MRLSALTFAALISASTLALAGPTTVPVIDLTPNNVPSVSAAEAVDTVREGTHFIARTGRLTHTTDGQQAIFVFDNNDGAATKSPPMLVLPNWNLLSMESVTATAGKAVNFCGVSGTVTEYKGRNYILIDTAQTTSAAVVAAAPVVLPAPKETTAPAPATASKPTTVKVSGISTADQMMNHLLAPQPLGGQPLRNVIATSATSTNDATTGQAAIAPEAPVLKIKREGTHLVNRIGRLNHSPDGQQATFTFDTDGKTMQDPPVVIMPNLKLTAMEGAVLGKAMDVHFRISGTVTEYKGRNYILLDKAVAIADVEVQF